jgi:hypothetical protein
MLLGTGYPSGENYLAGTGMELFFYPHADTGNLTGKILRVRVWILVDTPGYVPVAILTHERSARRDPPSAAPHSPRHEARGLTLRLLSRALPNAASSAHPTSIAKSAAARTYAAAASTPTRRRCEDARRTEAARTRVRLKYARPPRCRFPRMPPSARRPRAPVDGACGGL